MSNILSTLINMEKEAILFNSIARSISRTIQHHLRRFRNFTNSNDVESLEQFDGILNQQKSVFWNSLILMIDLRNILLRLLRRNLFTQLMSGHSDIRLLFWNL